MFNGSLSNESTYITAEFEAAHWPTRFILGDGNQYGRFLNRKLIRSWNYRAYIIAFTDEAAAQNQHNKKQSQLNMVGLSDILNTKNKASNFLESDLFTASSYSDIFNTNTADANQNAIMNTMGISVNDFHNILWVAGAIACFIFLIVIIIVLSLRVMQKKNKLGSNRQISLTNNNNMTTTLTRGGNVGGGGSTASTTTTATTRAMDTAVTFEKMGTIRTNTLKSNNTNSNTVKSNGNIIYPNKIPGNSSSSHQLRASSSSSSSTTVSPTTALLSCSVNNNSNHNFGAASSQSSNSNSNNTNNTNVILTNGLLTTASPLKLNNMMTMMSDNGGGLVNPSESLYTSIEVRITFERNNKIKIIITQRFRVIYRPITYHY